MANVDEFTALEDDLVRIAKSGKIAPLFFAVAMCQVPGYDKTQAVGIENQIFDSKGFPTINSAGVG